MKELPRLDSRVRVVRHEQNRGFIPSANEGLDQATGDYLVLLSADDALAPGWLDRGVALLEREPQASFAIGPIRTFVGPLPRLHLSRPVRPIVHPGHDWLEVSCRTGHPKVRSPEAIVRASTHRENGGYNPKLAYTSDAEMWLRLASRGDVIEVRGLLPGTPDKHVSGSGAQRVERARRSRCRVQRMARRRRDARARCGRPAVAGEVA